LFVRRFLFHYASEYSERSEPFSIEKAGIMPAFKTMG